MKKRRKVNFRRPPPKLSFSQKIFRLEVYIKEDLPYKILSLVLPTALYIFFHILYPIYFFFEALIFKYVFKFFFIKHYKKVRYLLGKFIIICYFFYDKIERFCRFSINFILPIRLIHIIINFLILKFIIVPVSELNLKLNEIITNWLRNNLIKHKVLNYFYTAMWIRNLTLAIICLFLLFCSVQLPGFMCYWPFSIISFSLFFQFFSISVLFMASRRIRDFWYDWSFWGEENWFWIICLSFSLWCDAQDITPDSWGYFVHIGYEEFYIFGGRGRVINYPFGF